MRVKLIGLDSENRRRKFVVRQLPVLIGRSPEAEIHVDDRWASRHHCQLDEVDGALLVRDLRSSHGTLVNGSPVTEAPLQPGNQLTVGMSSFQAQYRPSRKRLAPR